MNRRRVVKHPCARQSDWTQGSRGWPTSSDTGSPPTPIQTANPTSLSSAAFCCLRPGPGSTPPSSPLRYEQGAPPGKPVLHQLPYRQQTRPRCARTGSAVCGQGRGRTGDLPLFRRTLVPTELPGRATSGGFTLPDSRRPNESGRVSDGCGADCAPPRHRRRLARHSERPTTR